MDTKSVWCVLKYDTFTGNELHNIFSSKEEAEKYAQLMVKTHGITFDVEEWPLLDAC